MKPAAFISRILEEFQDKTPPGNIECTNFPGKSFVRGLIKVDLEFSFSILGLFQTWNSNKPAFEKLNSRSEPGFGKLNSRSELELSKKNNN